MKHLVLPTRHGLSCLKSAFLARHVSLSVSFCRGTLHSCFGRLHRRNFLKNPGGGVNCEALPEACDANLPESVRGLPQRSCKSMTRPEHRAAMRNMAWLCRYAWLWFPLWILWRSTLDVCCKTFRFDASLLTEQMAQIYMITHFKKPWVTSST